MIKRSTPKSGPPSAAVGAYGAPPVDKNQIREQLFGELERVVTRLRYYIGGDAVLDTVAELLRGDDPAEDPVEQPPSNTVGAVQGNLYVTTDRADTVAIDCAAAKAEKEIRTILQQFIDTMDLCTDEIEYVDSALDRLIETMQDAVEDAPVPIYAGPLPDDYVVMAYGGPEVGRPYRPTERVKRWNRDRGQHPYREPRVVSMLSDQGFNANHIDRVLDVLDNICTSCWDAAAGCQCENDE